MSGQLELIHPRLRCVYFLLSQAHSNSREQEWIDGPLWFGRVEAETDVVGGPVAIGVAEGWFEQSDCFGYCDCAISWVELIEDAVAEGVEPGFHAVGEWRGAGDESD